LELLLFARLSLSHGVILDAGLAPQAILASFLGCDL
jgi:hypothetical protein